MSDKNTYLKPTKKFSLLDTYHRVQSGPTKEVSPVEKNFPINIQSDNPTQVGSKKTVPFIAFRVALTHVTGDTRDVMRDR